MEKKIHLFLKSLLFSWVVIPLSIATTALFYAELIERSQQNANLIIITSLLTISWGFFAVLFLVMDSYTNRENTFKKLKWFIWQMLIAFINILFFIFWLLTWHLSHR